MGSSGTYPIVGIAPIDDTREGLYPAMTLTEAAQEIAKAERDGHPIKFWFSQTKQGERMLGNPPLGEITTTDGLRPRLPRLVGCPVCKGFGCVCCRWSGILRNGYWKRWAEWQIEDIAREAEALAAAAKERGTP